MQPRFIHLNVHTEYSIFDGIVRIDSLLQRLVTLNMPAVAITDLSNFFGLVKFYKEALKLGIKPIIGTEFFLENESFPTKPYHITLLAKDHIGYKNLLTLISRTYLEGQKDGLPKLHKSWLTINSAEGLIALSSGIDGDIGEALLVDNLEKASSLLNHYQQIFPNNFYLELQRTKRANEETYISKALDLAQRHGVPVVATNGVRFVNREDFEAHEARICIHDGYTLDDPKRPRLYSEEQYLRSEEEMLALFSDIPEALQNSVEIAKRCNVEITLGKNFLPIFPLPNNEESVEEFFVKEANHGLKERLASILKNENNKLRFSENDYQTRLDYEIKIIKKMGFASYFLIVADFIRWAKENDIPVGPGRGSGAGSLVAYSLKITDLDPLEHELLFERFLNPERVSLPDFDVDFCMDGRDRVIDYVIKRYGPERVAQIVTHGTMAAKAVVRDVGRVLGYPYGFVDKIAKLIPFTLGITLEDALKQEEVLRKRYEEDDEVKTLIDLALKLEGITRNVGKHAGGIVIAPTKLTDFTPLYCEEGSFEHSVTQFDKNDVEAIGLVKFDFLGLRTLTIIASALKHINHKAKENNETPLDIAHIPLDDSATFKLIQSGQTTAVFQIESRGMKDLTKRIKPDRFADIIALNALFRPGPIQAGMVDDFVERKHGRAKIIYSHPLLEPVLKSTYGVILYQEQVMQIAQVLAGYSLGSADILRSAMGKKKVEEMAKQRTIFLEGANKKNIDKHVANTIFDAMEKFAGYGFNKAHSTAYSLIAYQTAYLKAHYPAEFMAAVLSSDMDNTDKTVKMILECKEMGLKIIPPDINNSDYQFTVDKNGSIVYGLGAIKGVGAAAIENIITIRQDRKFKNFFDLVTRTDKQKTNRKVLEALIKSGALDSIAPNRASAFSSITVALQIAENKALQNSQKQFSLFDSEVFTAETTEEEDVNALYVPAEPWSQDECLNGEKSTLGFYLSGHPIQRYEDELQQFALPLILLADKQNQNTVVAGFITNVRPILTKTQKHIAIVTLEDATSSSEAVVFTDLYTKKRDLLIEDQIVIIEGEVDFDNFRGSMRLRARDVLTLEEARAKYISHLNLTLTCVDLDQIKLNALLSLLKPHVGGSCPISIAYLNNNNKAKLILGDNWRIYPRDILLLELNKMFGKENIKLVYKK